MAAVALVAISLGVGRCTCHEKPQDVTGIIINGSSDHTMEGGGVSLLGTSIVVCSCGHAAPLISSFNMNNMTNGYPKGSVGSMFSACPTGMIVTGTTTAS